MGIPLAIGVVLAGDTSAATGAGTATDTDDATSYDGI
jgi:hypothetical protein